MKTSLWKKIESRVGLRKKKAIRNYLLVAAAVLLGLSISHILSNPAQTLEAKLNYIDAQDNGVQFVVGAQKDVLPEESKLVVEEITGDQYDELVAEVLKDENYSDEYVYHVYDVRVEHEGQEIEPNGEVSVKLEMDAELDGANYDVIHLAENGTGYDMEVLVNGAETEEQAINAEFSVEGFSPFIIVEYIKIVIPGPITTVTDTMKVTVEQTELGYPELRGIHQYSAFGSYYGVDPSIANMVAMKVQFEDDKLKDSTYQISDCVITFDNGGLEPRSSEGKNKDNWYLLYIDYSKGLVDDHYRQKKYYVYEPDEVTSKKVTMENGKVVSVSFNPREFGSGTYVLVEKGILVASGTGGGNTGTVENYMIKINGEIGYCFNIDRNGPNRSLSYRKITNATAKEFFGSAYSPRKDGDTQEEWEENLKANLMRVIYNGYPNNAGYGNNPNAGLYALIEKGTVSYYNPNKKYNYKSTAEQRFYGATQMAVWYYTDNLDLATLTMSFEMQNVIFSPTANKDMLEVYLALTGRNPDGTKCGGTTGVACKYELQEPPGGSSLDIYISPRQSYQHILNASFGNKKITVSKVDLSTKQEVAGATLWIQGTTKSGESVDVRWVSQGTAHVVNLDEGEYTLTEIFPPAYYLKADPIDFRIVNVNGELVLQIKQSDGTYVDQKDSKVTMYDERIPDDTETVRVVKKWGSGTTKKAIYVQLFLNGQPYKDADGNLYIQKLDESNNWGESWEGWKDLPKGKDYVYTVKEVVYDSTTGEWVESDEYRITYTKNSSSTTTTTTNWIKQTGSNNKINGEGQYVITTSKDEYVLKAGVGNTVEFVDAKNYDLNNPTDDIIWIAVPGKDGNHHVLFSKDTGYALTLSRNMGSKTYIEAGFTTGSLDTLYGSSMLEKTGAVIGIKQGTYGATYAEGGNNGGVWGIVRDKYGLDDPSITTPDLYDPNHVMVSYDQAKESMQYWQNAYDAYTKYYAEGDDQVHITSSGQFWINNYYFVGQNKVGTSGSCWTYNVRKKDTNGTTDDQTVWTVLNEATKSLKYPISLKKSVAETGISNLTVVADIYKATGVDTDAYIPGTDNKVRGVLVKGDLTIGSDYVTIDDLEPADYYVYEKSVSDPRVTLNSKAFKITINADGTYSYDGQGNMLIANGNGCFNLVNRYQKTEIKLAKIATGGTTLLSGAKFTLYKVDANGTLTIDGKKVVMVSEITTSATANTVKNLEIGEYYLVEDKTPNDNYYVKLSKPVHFEITGTTNGNSATVDFKIKLLEADSKVTLDEDKFIFVVANDTKEQNIRFQVEKFSTKDKDSAIVNGNIDASKRLVGAKFKLYVGVNGDTTGGSGKSKIGYDAYHLKDADGNYLYAYDTGVEVTSSTGTVQVQYQYNKYPGTDITFDKDTVFYLVETEAPNQYLNITYVFTFKALYDADGNVVVDGDGYVKIDESSVEVMLLGSAGVGSVNGQWLNVDGKDVYVIAFYDSPVEYRLPETGGMGTWGYTLWGAMLLCGSALYMYIRREEFIEG